MEKVSYHAYLKLSELLSLQEELSKPKHNDELLFIVIHQSHELWFKLVLHEIQKLKDLIDEDAFFHAAKTMSRIISVFKALREQVDVLHTLTPDEFLGYRDLLAPASGFQSYQYKMIEFSLGPKDERYLERYTSQPVIYLALKQAFSSPTVWDKVIHLLHRQGFPNLESILSRNKLENYASNSSVLEVIKKIYQEPKKYSSLHYLFEQLTELDLTIQLWRLSHLKNAERTIGSKIGTGGSSGIDYLQSTLSKKCFPELWEVRSVL